MGTGILANIKHLAPLSLYLLGVFFFLKGLMGDGRWAIMLATFLIPLRNIIEKIQDYPLGNQFVDLLVVGALIGLLITSSKQNKPLGAPSNVNFIILILMGYMFVSLLMGYGYLNMPFAFDDRLKDLKNFYLMPLLFFITLNYFTDRVWIVRMLMVMAFAMLIMNYYTTDQIRDFSLASRDKISGTFQFLGVNEVAAFYNQYTIILLSIFFFIKNKKIKWPLLILILINIYCILFFYSRGAYLGLFAGMFLLFSFKKQALLIPLILLAIFWQSILPEQVIVRIKQTTNENGQLDESSQTRIDIWQQSLEVFQQNPLTGVGLGVFHYLSVGGFGLGDTHNVYVKYLVEQGLVGIGIFLTLLFCFLRMGYTLYKKGEDDLSKGMGLGLMCCIVVLSVNNFFGDRWTYMEISAYLWVFAGLVGRLIILAQEEKTTPTPISTPIAQKQKKKLRYYDM